jgi:hypothetical protein
MSARQRVKFRLQEERYSCKEPPTQQSSSALLSSSSSSNNNNFMMPRQQQQQQQSAPRSVSTEEETAVTAAQRSTTSGGTSKSGDEGNSWRKPGKMYRARLVAQDDQEGGGGSGKSFRISNQCAIERYYQVADKVQYQFLNHPVDTKDEFIEAYLVGTRLCKFLSRVLPTHVDYFSNNPQLVDLRVDSQAQLAELLPYLDQLERVIDEDEHQAYISQILGTEAEGEADADAEVDQDIDGDVINTSNDDDWEDVEDEDDAHVQEPKMQENERLVEYQHQFQQPQQLKQQQQHQQQQQQHHQPQQQHQQSQQQHQQPKQQPPDLQKDSSCVNTTMTSYEWTANNPNESLDMDLILDGSNSLIDSFTGEDLLDQLPQQPAQPISLQRPLQSSLRPPQDQHQHAPPPIPPPKISPPPKTQTSRRSPSPSLRSSPSPPSSRKLESPAPSQRAAAVSWDTAWQRTALPQGSPKQQQQPEQPRHLQQSSPKQQQQPEPQRHAPVMVQENSQEDDSVWSRTATLQERVAALSPVRPLRNLHHEESSSQDSSLRQQQRRNRIAAAATSKSSSADSWAHIPDDEYEADYAHAAVEPNSDRAVDEWNLPYSATTPDWISVSSSADDTDDLASEWNMNLSTTSSAFHQTPLAATPAQMSPLPPPWGITKIKSRERRRRNPAPMTKLTPVKEFPSISELPSARPFKESSISNQIGREEDFVDHIATAFVDQDTDLLWDSKIERRWQRATRKPPRSKVGNHSFTSFTTLREGSPKSIIDMDNWKDDSREDVSKTAKEYGKQTLLLNKYKSSDMSMSVDSINVSTSAVTTRNQEMLRRLGEDPDDSESFVDNRALTRRGRALQPFKSCVKCLID